MAIAVALALTLFSATAASASRVWTVLARSPNLSADPFAGSEYGPTSLGALKGYGREQRLLFTVN
jgi:hypothetical protein